ncbi:MAG: ribonuclease J [Corallococcus sp.]|nr:ribonuclease J [Corallococcus sp.]
MKADMKNKSNNQTSRDTLNNGSSTKLDFGGASSNGRQAARKSNVGNNSALKNKKRESSPSEFARRSKPQGKLKIMFLGGVGEIGKNMTVFEYGDSIVVLDAGMTFPGSDMPGVDVVIPDMSYLCENRSKIRAILLTHGHEDHIGAIPFLVEKLGGKIDIYGTKLTLALVENKLIEHNVYDKVNLVAVSSQGIVTLGAFTAEFIHVSHSVAGSVAICLRCPVGTVLHTGDFKIDYTPLGNEIMNLNRIAEIGKQGVLLLMSESTNVEKPGYTMSESVVQDTINKVFHEAKGRRIIIATFASNIDRIGMIIELAAKYKRKIAVSGRSMLKYIETAQRIGMLNVDPKIFVDMDKVASVEDGKLVILSTGSQGEPMSALTRMASGEFNKVQIGSNDTIVISATPIPGNERDIYNVINKLYRLGAVVVYSALQAVHVSGHACQEELKLVYTLVKPKYFIPVHGEYRHLKQHAMLVEQLHHKRSNIIIPEIGDCVEVDNSTFKVAGQVVSGNVMVDGLGVGDVSNVVLRDRLSLAEDGICVCVVGFDKRSGRIVGDVEMVSRGCFFATDVDAVNPVEEVKKLVKEELSKAAESTRTVAFVKTVIQRTIRHYFRVTLKRNPVVLPVILEV